MLRPMLDAMRRAAEDFEGTVIRVTGDGILALFGAPRALEGHALLACRAAEATHAALARLPAQPLVRIGLHSGDLIAAQLGSANLGDGAFGATLHLASRIEQLAPAGATYLSAATFEFVRGHVDARLVGDRSVKGFDEAVRVYELLALDPPSSVAAPAVSTRLRRPQPRDGGARQGARERARGQGARRRDLGVARRRQESPVPRVRAALSRGPDPCPDDAGPGLRTCDAVPAGPRAAPQLAAPVGAHAARAGAPPPAKGARLARAGIARARRSARRLPRHRRRQRRRDRSRDAAEQAARPGRRPGPAADDEAARRHRRRPALARRGERALRAPARLLGAGDAHLRAAQLPAVVRRLVDARPQLPPDAAGRARRARRRGPWSPSSSAAIRV